MQPAQDMLDLVTRFGDPTPFLREDGGIHPKWELQILGMIPLPAPLQLAFIPPGMSERPWVSRVRCHRLVAAELLSVYQAIHDAGLWPRLGRFGGCYEWRRQRKAAHAVSMHSWGIAVDHGSDVDPQGDPVIDTDGGVVAIFEARGWRWGGRWPGARRDAMHWDYCTVGSGL